MLPASAICGDLYETKADGDLFSTLIEYKADLDAPDPQGNNVLHVLVQPTWYGRLRYTTKARARRDPI